jgi:hypothetical protein
LTRTPAQRLAINRDGRAKLNVVLVETLDLQSHGLDQATQPLMLDNRSQNVVNF